MRFAVYRFESPDEIDTVSGTNIVAVTPELRYRPTRPGVYVVTAIDRVNNESEASIPVVIK